MSKRIIASLLLSLFLISSVACSGGSGTDVSSDSTSSSDVVTTAPEGVVDTSYSGSLESVDYGGSTFKIVSTNSLNDYTYPTTQNFASESNGEVVNDALYDRDRWLEDKFNVKVEYTDARDGGLSASQGAKRIMNSVMAGDYEYDLVIEDMAQYTRMLADNGVCYSLNMVDGIDLSADYWFPELNNVLKIGESQCFVACPLSPRFYGSVYIIMFNRDLAADLGLDSFYDMVKSGAWTFEALDKASTVALADIDGDTFITKNDRFGFAYEGLTAYSMMIGTGNHYIKNDGDTLRVTLNDENIVNILQEMAKIFDSDYGFMYDNDTTGYWEILESGRYLFQNTCTFNLAGFRDYTYDYGILPMPKYDEEQDGYYGYSQPFANAGPIIPLTVSADRLSMVGTLTNAMCAYGYDYIRPAVFENVIQLKGARDEASAEIIDMIFDNITFDFTFTLPFTSLRSVISNYCFNSDGSAGIASSYAAYSASISSEIDAIMENYAELMEKLS